MGIFGVDTPHTVRRYTLYALESTLVIPTFLTKKTNLLNQFKTNKHQRPGLRITKQPPAIFSVFFANKSQSGNKIQTKPTKLCSALPTAPPNQISKHSIVPFSFYPARTKKVKRKSVYQCFYREDMNRIKRESICA